MREHSIFMHACVCVCFQRKKQHKKKTKQVSKYVRPHGLLILGLHHLHDMISPRAACKQGRQRRSRAHAAAVWRTHQRIHSAARRDRKYSSVRSVRWAHITGISDVWVKVRNLLMRNRHCCLTGGPSGSRYRSVMEKKERKKNPSLLS